MPRLEDDLKQKRPFSTDKERLLVSIMRTSAWVCEQLDRMLEPYDITQQQYNVLRILRGSSEPLSTCDIRQRMIDRASDTSRIVDRLVEKGLAEKCVSELDRRRLEVRITEQGLRLLGAFDPVLQQFHQLADVLTRTERSILMDLLDTLRSQER